MTVFEGTAAYYDELYSDKDYAGEVSYVESLMREFAGQGKLSILDLGSGTGKHAVALGMRGYTVHGVDRSDQMVAQAEARKSTLAGDSGANVSFSVGDVRSVRLGRQFDVVLA